MHRLVYGIREWTECRCARPQRDLREVYHIIRAARSPHARGKKAPVDTDDGVVGVAALHTRLNAGRAAQSVTLPRRRRVANFNPLAAFSVPRRPPPVQHASATYADTSSALASSPRHPSYTALRYCAEASGSRCRTSTWPILPRSMDSTSPSRLRRAIRNTPLRGGLTISVM